ncbi:MAG: hypothetical protein ACREL6_00475, partial [Gemmatimonadales bacterium]
AETNPLPAIDLLDAGVERRVTPYAVLRGEVRDIGNTRATFIAGYPTPGRTWILTLTLNLP